MANQPPNSSRSSAAAFTNVADIGAALVALTGFPAGTLGFEGPADGYRAFRPGDRLVAKGPAATSEYVVQLNLAGTDVVAVQTFPSAAGSSLPDIVYVTARPAKYPGLSSAVYPDLVTGEAALPATGGTLIVLDDDYVLTAPLVLRNNMRLFSYSRTGTQITNGTAGATIETQGNAEFTNIRFDNGVGEPAIRLVGPGTITMNGCECGAGAVPVAIDALTNAVALAVVLNESEVAGSIVGDAIDNSSLVGRQSRISAVVFGPGGGVSLKGCSHGSIDTLAAASLEECVSSGATSIGVTNEPLTLTMTNCRLSGGGTVDCGVLVARNVRMTGLYAVTVTNTADLEDTDIEDLGTLTTAAGAVTATRSTVSGPLITPNALVGRRSRFGKVIAGLISTELCTFTLDVTSTGTFFDVASYLANSNVDVATQLVWTHTICFGRVTVNAQSEFNACYVQAANGLTGAIIMVGGATVNLRGVCFVRAEDTLFSVSGVGTVSAQGSVSGGCRYDTSAVGFVVANTVSDVRGHSVIGPVAIPGNTDLTTLGGGTNELFDTFLLVDNAGGSAVQVYAAAYTPNGYEVVVSNYGALNSFTLVPFAGDAFNGGLLPAVVLASGESVRFRRVAINDWLVLRY